MTRGAPEPVVAIEPGPLSDEVLRLAAAAGCDPVTVADAVALRERWSSAALVVLDAETAGRCADSGLPRRDSVVVVADRVPEPEVWRDAVAVGAEHVAVLPDAEAWLVGAFAEAREATGEPGRVLAVVGGRGGAGASVLAVAVGAAAVDAGRGALLVDCDPLGGGLDLVVGAEDIEGLRWGGIGLDGGRVSAASLHAALPRRRHGAGLLTVLSCDRAGPAPDAAAVRAVCSAGRRAGDTVVCDLPRSLGPAAAVALSAADLVLMVVPAEVRACAAAAAVAHGIAALGAAPWLIVRGPAPGGLRPADVARSLGVPLLAAMRPQPSLAADLDRGRVPGTGRGPLAATARLVLRTLHDTEQVHGHRDGAR